MKNFLSFLLLCLSIVAYSQNDIGGTTITDGFKMKAGALKGTPYLLTDWVSGYAVDNNGNLTEEKLLNYNIYENVLTFKPVNGSKDIMAINSDSYSGFILIDETGKNYLFTKVDGDQFEKHKKETAFYQIVAPPSKYVLLETKKILNDPNKSGWISSQNPTKRAEFNTSTTYYVLAEDDIYYKISLNNGSVIKAFSDKKKEVSAFIKKNNLKIRTAEDVNKVAEYYHSL